MDYGTCGNGSWGFGGVGIFQIGGPYMKGREDIDSRIIVLFHSLDQQDQNEVLNEIVQKMPSADAITLLNKILKLKESKLH